ncbi:MAG: hypothetical protein ACP5KG_06580, partial [Myxococcota bacterium]
MRLYVVIISYVILLIFNTSCTSTATDNTKDASGESDVISLLDVISTDTGGCRHGDSRECYNGPARTKNIGICRAGIEYCINGVWGGCEGEILPKSSEICGNNADDNCDGVIDENCPCSIGSVRECYGGPPETRGVGICKSGFQGCIDDGSGKGVWGDCEGQVLPDKDSCVGVPAGGLPIDGDCDGEVDKGVVNACGRCGPEPVEV